MIFRKICAKNYEDWFDLLLVENLADTGSCIDDLGDYFRSLWGPFAGWAQSVSFLCLLFN